MMANFLRSWQNRRKSSLYRSVILTTWHSILSAKLTKTLQIDVFVVSSRRVYLGGTHVIKFPRISQ